VTPHRARRSGAAALAAAVLAVLLVPAPATAAELAPGEVSVLLARLRVEPESSTPGPADAFGPWADGDGDGCDTASEVLTAESLVTVTHGPGCTVDTGSWRSPWDGEVVGAEDVVVEHAVPLAEAWQSGADAWTDQQRTAFRNDLGGDAFHAVSPAVSQARGEQDPSTWLPPVQGAWCGYLTDWVVVKSRWDLSVDPSERGRLASALDGCAPWVLYKAPHSGTVYELVTRADGSQSPVPISFGRWRDAYGFAPFQPAPTQIVRYPWSSTLYAVTRWPGGESAWKVERLSFAQWQYAGFPAPTATGWVPGSRLHQYPTSAQIFLTAPEGGVPHALSYAEWAASGFRPYDLRANEGFVKLSWDAGIVHMTNLAASTGSKISYATWAQHGFPNPQLFNRLSGDRVYRNFGTRTVFYTGPTVSRPITFAEWQVMGLPAPEVRNVPSTADKDCPDYPSRAAAQRDFDLWRSEGYGDIFRLDGDDDGIACESYFG
jgi:hypothetical protein